MTCLFKCPRCGWSQLDEDMRKLSNEVDEFIKDLQKDQERQKQEQKKYVQKQNKHPRHKR